MINKALSKATAMAMAGRAVRPCDACGRERARWFCAADEAYLCESCDGSVHGANALALRHERVRLAPNGAPMKRDRLAPDSHAIRGRQKREGSPAEDGGGSGHLKRKFKILRQFQGPNDSPAMQAKPGVGHLFEVKLEPSIVGEDKQGCFESSFHEPSCKEKIYTDSDYADQFLVPDQFDVNQVLNSEEGLCCDGDGVIGNIIGEIDQGESGIGELDLTRDRGASDEECCADLTNMVAMSGSPSDCDYSSVSASMGVGGSGLGEVEDIKHFAKSRMLKIVGEESKVLSEEELRQVPCLKLDYADVLSAWSDRGTLWTEACNPQIVPDDAGSDAELNLSIGLVPDLCGDQSGQVPLLSYGEDNGNAGIAREARVMRYREKRRTRLFSKKIRYEVRKLNAERRPRMKGRFVKRSLVND